LTLIVIGNLLLDPPAGIAAKVAMGHEMVVAFRQKCGKQFCQKR
jgi:hypothetical protein